MFILAEAWGGCLWFRVCACVKANSVVDEKSEVIRCRSALQVGASAIHPCVFLQCVSIC